MFAFRRGIIKKMSPKHAQPLKQPVNKTHGFCRSFHLGGRQIYLIQHHFGDVWQSLRFMHAGTDELEAQQEFTVIFLLLFRVDGLPLFCGKSSEEVRWWYQQQGQDFNGEKKAGEGFCSGERLRVDRVMAAG